MINLIKVFINFIEEIDSEKLSVKLYSKKFIEEKIEGIKSKSLSIELYNYESKNIINTDIIFEVYLSI